MSLRDDTERTAYSFLLTDIQMGLTFANSALTSLDNPEKKERNINNARKAYDTVIHLREGRVYSVSQSLALEAGLEKLRLSLIKLGESL